MKEELEYLQEIIRKNIIRSDEILKNEEQSPYYVIGYLQGVLKMVDKELENLK